MNDPQAEITQAIQSHAGVDAIYLYGSRAKNTARPDSDWDIAVIFSDYETDPLQRAVRPQLLEAEVERDLKRYNQISIVDLETAPTLLQVGILQSVTKWYDRNVPHVRRIEQSIWSKWEKDYERYCL
ncbi:type VII toxin-antitoxin system MntA family adenylyltransferase antitoxin [Methylomonas koyamae]|uniref:type VII toxin-antitoxin system MntA family adenylyltransferase antitoxin n=1 Tax=Methylomonas koyamae TaxID=702114 RepID=UPI000BC2F4F9|nr:nucleotidyltransferase domain-containing protein [Methylomonas koyamae]ATG89754.1 DNA polymerase subunit beta [Methylomonas koyamae]